MPVRALVFDVFGTLVDWRSSVAAAFAEAGMPGDPGELADEWRERFWPIIGAILGGERDWANFDELHAETLGALLAPRLLGLEADDVMLVAAHPLDLEGARRAGLRSAFVDRPLEYGPDSPPREDPKADFSVADLHELADALAA